MSDKHIVPTESRRCQSLCQAAGTNGKWIQWNRAGAALLEHIDGQLPEIVIKECLYGRDICHGSVL